MAEVKERGIVLWEQLRLKKLKGQAREDALRDIRLILAGASRPAKLKDESWKGFQNFWPATNGAAQVEVISRFEWADSALAADAMEARIGEQLVHLGHAADKTGAGELYCRLFVRVIKLLATPGDKILSAQMLHEALAQPLSTLDRQIFASVFLRLSNLEGDVADLQEWRIDQTQRQQQVSALLAQLPGFENSQFAFAVTPVLPSFSAPEPVEHLSNRHQSTQQLLDSLSTSRWLALEGDISCGKTHLAILIAGHFSARWLSLRDLNGAQTLQQLDAACFALAGSPSTERLDEFFERSGSGALWVLDDLPRMNGYDALAQRLVEWTRASARHGVSIFSTSHFALPPEIGERLGTLVQRVPCPKLSDDEAGEFLISYGAPAARFGSMRTKFINSQVNGHPLLLAAFARYLSQRNWRLGDDEIDALLHSKFASELQEQTLNRLLNNVKDQERELLYRFNTRHTALTREEVNLLASVAPVVEHPGEKLAALTGLWVQRGTDSKFWPSPLVRVLGESELALGTRLACHDALAHHVLKKGRLNQFDLVEVILHFAEAHQWDKAAGFLGHGLFLLWQEKMPLRPEHDGGLTAIWSEMPLPEGINLSFRLIIRSYQIALADSWGETPRWLVQDLNELLSKVTPDASWAVSAVLVLASESIAKFDFALHCRIVGEAIGRLSYSLLLPDGSPLTVPEEGALESFVWMSVRHIHNASDLNEWLELIEKLSPENRQRAENDPIAPDGCLEVSLRLWRSELQKEEADRDWNALVQVLSDAARRAFDVGMPILGAALTRTTITIRGENQSDLDGAFSLAYAAVGRSQDDDEAGFLVEECLGRAYGVAGQTDNAAYWLGRAADRRGNRFAQQRMQALICYSKAVAEGSRASTAEAARLCRRAVEVAQSLASSEQARAWGELAIAAWLDNDWPTTLEAMEAAARQLLSLEGDGEPDKTDSWKQAFVLIGHALGYLVSQALHNEATLQTWDGEAYAVPHRSMMLGLHPALVALYQPEREIFLWVQLSSLAAALNDDERALKWALPAWETAQASNQSGEISLAVCGLAFLLIPHWIETNSFELALHQATEQAQSIVKSRVAHEQGISTRSLLSLQPTTEVALNENDRQLVEAWTATVCLIPTVFRLALTSLEFPEQAAPHAREVARLCRQHAANSHDADFWESAALLIDEAFVIGTSYRQLLEHKFPSQFGDLYNILLIIGYIGASLDKEMPLADALQLHLACLPTLDNRFLKNDRASYRRLVGPYCYRFWLTQLQKRPQEFNDHSLVLPEFLNEQVLREATRIKSEIRIKQLFMVLSIALDTGGSEEARSWLSSVAEFEW